MNTKKAYKINKINKNELLEYLNLLRDLLKRFDYKKIDNVIFFNFDSYLNFVSTECTIRKELTVEEILYMLEPFIPFEFDEKTLDFLISNIIDNYDPIKFQNVLLKRAKIDFIDKIKKISNKDDWNKIVKNCKDIHEHLESIEMLYV